MQKKEGKPEKDFEREKYQTPAPLAQLAWTLSLSLSL